MSRAAGRGEWARVDQAGETATGRMISVANFTLLPCLHQSLDFARRPATYGGKKDGARIEAASEDSDDELMMRGNNIHGLRELTEILRRFLARSDDGDLRGLNKVAANPLGRHQGVKTATNLISLKFPSNLAQSNMI